MRICSRPSRRLSTSSSIICASLALLVSGCEEEVVEQAPVARPVKMLELGAGGAGGTLEYPGQISATQQSDMAFEIPGRMLEFPVDEGQDVEKGRLLAALDSRDYDNQLNAQIARRNAAKAEYDRISALYETGAASGSDLDVARRNYEVTVSAVDTARKAVEDTQLRAPFAGKVARKLVEDFANVRAKQTVLILQDTSGLEVIISVPERDWTQYARGSATLEESNARARPVVTISSLPDRPFAARFKEKATTADPVTRTFAVTLAFDPPDDVRILPGMTARVTLTIPDAAQTAGFVIPANAVVPDESGNPFVWVVDTGSMQVSRRPVELGDIAGSDVTILNGLSKGDVVAISGVHQLRDDMVVRRMAN